MGCGQSKVADVGGKAAPVMVPGDQRKCRDVVWLLLFSAYLVGMVGVFLLASKSGDPARLLYAIDSSGQQCGGIDSVCYDGKPCGKFANYPRIDKDFAMAVKGGLDLSDPAQVLSIPFYSVCLNGCAEGEVDVDGDGQIRDWVCSYNNSKILNDAYPAAQGEKWDNKEIPSLRAKAVLEECNGIKQSYGGAFGDYLLSDSETLSDSSTARCKTLLKECFKMYVPERSIFFRCVPENLENTTCAASPYLESNGTSVQTMEKDGKTIPRPASDPHCGTCIDPVYNATSDPDAAKTPMDPSSKECRAKKVLATSESVTVASNPIFDSVNSVSALIERWMGDVKLTWVVIVTTGGAGAVVLGVIWLVLLRYLAGVFVWVVLWGLFACLGLLSAQCAVNGGMLEFEMLGKSQVGYEDMYRYATYASLVLTVIYLLILVAMFRKVRLAVQVLKEATKVVAIMPMIMAFPIVPVSLSLAGAGYWVYTSMLISSSGTIEIEDAFGGLVFDVNGTLRRQLEGESSGGAEVLASQAVALYKSSDMNTYLWIYNFFGFLWFNQVVNAVASCTIAGAVASHYWASEVQSEKVKKMPKNVVFSALKRTLRFHLGSLIFASFIIALVQLIRAALAYLDYQTKNLQKKNKVVMILMKVVQCCLWCFEKILKFVTKHAYIQIALKGKGFCSATKDAFVLMFSNLATIGMATAINNLILLFAKLVITAGCGILCFFLVNHIFEGDEAPSSTLVPVGVSVVIAFFVGSLFLSVYALAVDTILVCFCEDSARNDGSPERPYYMSDALKRISKKSNQMYKSEEKTRQMSNEDEDANEPSEEAAPSKASQPAQAQATSSAKKQML